MKKNYTTYYREDKHKVHSVPNHTSAVYISIMSVVVPLGALIVSALIRLGMVWGMENLGWVWEGWSFEFFAGVIQATILVVLFVEIAPRIGLFPGLFSNHLQLDENSDKDRQLAKLLGKNQMLLDATWLEDWSKGTASEQKRMLDDMKKVLHDHKKSNRDQDKQEEKVSA